MVLKLKKEWTDFDHYKNSFTKKYRARITVGQKKVQGIAKRELGLEEAEKYQPEIHSLYHHVAENASINTFFLASNHFQSLKTHLKDDFRIFGYFLGGELIGFYSLILNRKNIDTYFLGYKKELQKEKQLYLNMLLDMIKFGLDHGFEKIVFGRTALEIKSTIGAEPEELYGLMKHNNFIINQLVSTIFPYLEPKSAWIKRNPFKEN